MNSCSLTRFLRLVDAPQNGRGVVVIILSFRHGPFIARRFLKPLGIIGLLAEGHGVANTLSGIAARFLAVSVVVVPGVVVHLLCVLLKANHRKASVVACSCRLAAIEMPDTAIMGDRRWVLDVPRGSVRASIGATRQ